ncbi:hypothetical protein Tco_0799912 [Tanacetum coccineum]|uniref:Uncharacterized protein n=1 Tax=Tanacetum coccineum TaxID=301880 RepID=A0ABQ4ZRN3_9ASTR
MLAPKCPTFNEKPTFANPMYLKKAQYEKPCLYEIPHDQSDPANRLIPDREEILTLEEESRSKLNKDLVKPYDYTMERVLVSFVTLQVLSFVRLETTLQGFFSWFLGFTSVLGDLLYFLDQLRTSLIVRNEFKRCEIEGTNLGGLEGECSRLVSEIRLDTPYGDKWIQRLGLLSLCVGLASRRRRCGPCRVVWSGVVAVYGPRKFFANLGCRDGGKGGKRKYSGNFRMVLWLCFVLALTYMEDPRVSASTFCRTWVAASALLGDVIEALLACVVDVRVVWVLVWCVLCGWVFRGGTGVVVVACSGWVVVVGGLWGGMFWAWLDGRVGRLAVGFAILGAGVCSSVGCSCRWVVCFRGVAWLVVELGGGWWMRGLFIVGVVVWMGLVAVVCCLVYVVVGSSLTCWWVVGQCRRWLWWAGW